MIRPENRVLGLGPTAVILSGLALTSVVLPDDSAVSVFTVAAVGARNIVKYCNGYRSKGRYS